jgi:hypothetical protein
VKAAQRPGGRWIHLNYDKLLLVVALAALLISALILVLRITGNRREIERSLRAPAGVTMKEARVQNMAEYRGMLKVLNNPYQVPMAQRRMNVGEVRVSCVQCGRPIAFSATACPFCNVAQPSVDYDPDSDGDGMPDRWELAMGFNPNDPSDAHLDADGDGFTNLEEYLHGTNPHDPAEFPPLSAKLRLVRVIVNPFKFRFLGVSKLEDGDRYQLNLRTLERTYFPRMDDLVEGYKVLRYDEKAAGGPTLTLQQGDSVIRLIQGRVISQDARSAVLVFLIDGTLFRGVQVGSTVKLRDTEYKVVDIKDDRVLIRDEQAGKDATIGLLQESERMRLQELGSPQAPAAGASPAGL